MCVCACVCACVCICGCVLKHVCAKKWCMSVCSHTEFLRVGFVKSQWVTILYILILNCIQWIIVSYCQPKITLMTDTTHKTSLNPAKHLQPTHLTISDTYEYVIVTISTSTSTSTSWLFRRTPLWMKRWRVAASRESHGATSSPAPWPARHPSRSRRLWLRRGWGPSKTFQWPPSNSLDSVSYSLAHICQYEQICQNIICRSI